MEKNTDTPRILKDRLQSRSDRLMEFARTRKFGLIVAIVLGIVAVAVIVGGPPEESSEATKAVALPNDFTPSDDSSGLNLPIYDALSGSQDVDQLPKLRTQGMPLKLNGPKLLKRPRDISITPGALAMASLAIGASNGPVKAILTDGLVVNGEELIEPEAVLLGTGQSSEERLFIRFDKVVFKDGSMAAIQADAADSSDKTPGLKGSKAGQYALRLGGSIGLNFISGLSEGLQEKEVQGPAVVNKSTVRNAMLNGTNRAALDQSREMMSSLKNEKPVIEVPEGTSFYVLFGKEGG
ncbi:MAG: TrbI/VirB10 family protein [Pseudomonadota bacterium]